MHRVAACVGGLAAGAALAPPQAVKDERKHTGRTKHREGPAGAATGRAQGHCSAPASQQVTARAGAAGTTQVPRRSHVCAPAPQQDGRFTTLPRAPATQGLHGLSLGLGGGAAQRPSRPARHGEDGARAAGGRRCLEAAPGCHVRPAATRLEHPSPLLLLLRGGGAGRRERRLARKQQRPAARRRHRRRRHPRRRAAAPRAHGGRRGTCRKAAATGAAGRRRVRQQRVAACVAGWRRAHRAAAAVPQHRRRGGRGRRGKPRVRAQGVAAEHAAAGRRRGGREDEAALRPCGRRREKCGRRRRADGWEPVPRALLLLLLLGVVGGAAGVWLRCCGGGRRRRLLEEEFKLGADLGAGGAVGRRGVPAGGDERGQCRRARLRASGEGEAGEDGARGRHEDDAPRCRAWRALGRPALRGQGVELPSKGGTGRVQGVAPGGPGAPLGPRCLSRNEWQTRRGKGKGKGFRTWGPWRPPGPPCLSRTGLTGTNELKTMMR